MKSLKKFIIESLSDFGIDETNVSKFEIATAAFYFAAILSSQSGANGWDDYKEFAKKWGYGKKLHDYDYSGRSPKRVSTGEGLILFKHKGFSPKSIEEIFDEMYDFQWYYVQDMGKWSTEADDFWTCYGEGKNISCQGVIDKKKVTTWRQFKWNSKEEKWVYKDSQEKQSSKRFIYEETRKLDFVPIVLPYDEVLKAVNNEEFIGEFTSALENNFKSIKDDADRYNELQDRLKAEFEKRGIFRSLWSTGNIDKQLDALTGGHAKDIFEFIKEKMGSWASTFNVPTNLQNEICDKWKDDIEDVEMLKKWMSMDGHTAKDKYFNHKRYLKAKKIDVADE